MSEILPDITPNAMKLGFAYNVVVSPWICSEGAADDLRHAEQFASLQARWATGEEITPSDHRNMAALESLQAIVNSFEEHADIYVKGRLPFLWSDLVYEKARSVFGNLQLDFAQDQLDAGFRCAALACRHAVQDSDDYIIEKHEKNNRKEAIALRAAQSILRRRGSVTELQFSPSQLEAELLAAPMSERIPDTIYVHQGGIIEEGYKLPAVTDFPVEIPYYQQYLDPQHGSYEVFNAFCSDMISLDSELKKI